jgi:hypothetical protein
MFYAPLTNELREIRDRSYLVPLSESRNLRPNSSFIPGTKLQYVYDSVSLKLLQGCLRRYHYKMVEGWQETETPPALAWGRDFHTCAETYHKCRAHGLDHEVAVRRVARLAMLLGENLQSLDTSRSKETLVRSVVWYLDEYKDDPLRTAMLPDGKPAVELSFTLPMFDITVRETNELPELDFDDVVQYCKNNISDAITAVAQGRLLFGRLVGLNDLCEEAQRDARRSFYTITIHYAGHIDRVAHFGDEVFVTDYKSSKSALTLDWVKGFDRSTQFLGYYTAAQIMASQPNSVFPSPPAGVIVDGIQLGVHFTRFARFPLRYTAAQADEFIDNFRALVLTKAEPASRLDLWPTEAESECNAYRRRDGSGGCEFLQVCNAPVADRERQLRQRFHHSVWDPRLAR